MRRPAVILVALALAGCAGIPSSGPIRQGVGAGAGASEQVVRVIAAPPVAGMSPTQIVAGFLVASASFADGGATARSYLTAARAATWNPAAGVTEFAQDGLQLEANGSTVTGVGTVLATIGPTGEYRLASGAPDRTITFGLARVAGQWRIAAVPDGLLLSQFDILRSFRSYDVYFFDPHFSVLVPSPVTIAASGPTAATSLVQSLLQGPTPWLAKSVRSAFPADTHLTVPAVPIVNGVAEVDLSAGVLAANDQARAFLSAQLVWTLKALPEITAVRITVNGQPFVVSGAPAIQPTSSWTAFDPAGVGPSFGAIAWAGGRVARLATLPGNSPSTTSGPMLAESYAGDRYAISPGRSLQLVDSSGQVIRTLAEQVSGRPSFDREGGLWWAARGRLRYLPPGGAVPTTVRVGVRAAITGVAVARDGIRVVLEVSDPTPVLLLGRIGLTVPLTVDGLRPFVADPIVPTAFAWAGPDQVAVLGTESGSPFAAEIGIATGSASPLGTPALPESIAAAPGSPVLIGAGDGVVYESVGGAWAAVTGGANPAYPG